jgi:hypothetical protein
MVDSTQEARPTHATAGGDRHVNRLLRTAQIPAQGSPDDAGSPQLAAETGSEADHDHAWRRHPTQRGETFAEYRCDLCALSYLE